MFSSEFEEKLLYILDCFLIAVTALAICVTFFFQTTWLIYILAALSIIGLIPVVLSAIKSVFKHQVSIDLLASIALIFSLVSKEWFSAAFITLMLAFARAFDYTTQRRANRVIQSLMKYKVENVRIKNGDTVKEVHISQVKKGDYVIVDAGDKMPVDGVVISGEASVDESSLTGESELVSKKAGDTVFTSTVNQNGSLVVRTEKVGEDTTLAKIMKLVEESARMKSPAERVADEFTQWYIALSLVGSVILWFSGFSPQKILAILLVVCADDIAVAVPLAFTSAIAHSAKRGVIVKGSAAMEQLSRVKYILTDKTGTLTTGRPAIIDIKTYGSIAREKLLDIAASGASESKHAVSRAIMEYAKKNSIKVHAPKSFGETSGQGVSFSFNNERILLGRVTFLEKDGVHISEEVKKDIALEKDAGRGIALVAVNGTVAGLISYQDELRTHAKDILEETRTLGVREWHMLTGDNERAAAFVAHEVGMRHYHSNMTPESKVAFVHKFEREKEPAVVAYIGDGVNDAASLALADISIAMGGIGSDAAIEAADITIMKDRLARLPEAMRTARKVRSIMWQCFAIWAVTNGLGLLWVTSGIPGLGILGPVGAAAYNFLTDFIPIGNALRAGRK